MKRKSQAFVMSLLVIIWPTGKQMFAAAYPQTKDVCADTAASRGETQTGTEGAFINDKKSRTAAQKKIDSQLLYALKQRRGETRGVPTERINLRLDEKGRTLVDISAKISPVLISEIEKLGGTVISQSERYHTVRASLALEKLEMLASLKDVRFIAPVVKPITHGVKKN